MPAEPLRAARLPAILKRVVQPRRRGQRASVRAEERQPDAAVLERLEALEIRLGHLEAMIEGLQDAMHRESVRQGREIDELQRKAEPAEIRRALGRDAREHGI